MRFYKICAHSHPTSRLPSILWGNDAAVFEFTRLPGFRDVLIFETENPQLIDMLTNAGYLTEEPAGLTATIGAISMMDPNAAEGSKDKLTDETRKAFEARRVR
jgi:hypothetical protein